MVREIIVDRDAPDGPPKLESPLDAAKRCERVQLIVSAGQRQRRQCPERSPAEADRPLERHGPVAASLCALGRAKALELAPATAGEDTCKVLIGIVDDQSPAMRHHAHEMVKLGLDG